MMKQMTAERMVRRYHAKLWIYIAIAAAVIVWLFFYCFYYVADAGAPYLFAGLMAGVLFLLLYALSRRKNALCYALFAECDAQKSEEIFERMMEKHPNAFFEYMLTHARMLLGQRPAIPAFPEKLRRQYVQAVQDEYATLNDEQLFSERLRLLNARSTLLCADKHAYYMSELTAPYTYRRVLACFQLSMLKESPVEVEELRQAVAEAGGTLYIKKRL